MLLIEKFMDVIKKGDSILSGKNSNNTKRNVLDWYQSIHDLTNKCKIFYTNLYKKHKSKYPNIDNIDVIKKILKHTRTFNINIKPTLTIDNLIFIKQILSTHCAYCVDIINELKFNAEFEKNHTIYRNCIIFGHNELEQTCVRINVCCMNTNEDHYYYCNKLYSNNNKFIAFGNNISNDMILNIVEYNDYKKLTDYLTSEYVKRTHRNDANHKFLVDYINKYNDIPSIVKNTSDEMIRYINSCFTQKKLYNILLNMYDNNELDKANLISILLKYTQ
jgi:hypothetical protein